MEWAKSIMAILGVGSLIISAVSLTSYGLFKWFGEKWIDQKFKKQMEAYKTEQSRELERLRHKISGVFDRTKRLHTKEFEVLPDIWGKLVEAHAWVGNYTSPLQTYVDVGNLDAEELQEVLESTTFMEVQKRDIKNEKGFARQKLFIKISEIYRGSDARERMQIFGVSLKKDGIFLKPDIKADMDTMRDMLWDALTEKQLNEEDDIRPKLREHYKRLKADGQPLFNKIEISVAGRLWDSITTEV